MSSTLAPGSSTSQKDKALSGQPSHNTAEILKTAISMDKASSSSTTETAMKACIPMASLKVKELMLGVTAPTTKASSKMDLDSVLESGSTALKNMRETT